MCQTAYESTTYIPISTSSSKTALAKKCGFLINKKCKPKII